MAKNLNPDKPETMTIENCMKEMTSKEATVNAVRELIEWHVTKALKAASENATWDNTSHEISFGHSQGYDFIDTDYAGDPSTGYIISVNQNSILNAYPLTNII
jgi:hypothetical protein